MSSGVGCAAYMIFTEAAGTPAASDRTPHTTISKPFHYVGILSLPKESITCSCQDPSIKKIVKFGNAEVEGRAVSANPRQRSRSEMK